MLGGKPQYSVVTEFTAKNCKMSVSVSRTVHVVSGTVLHRFWSFDMNEKPESSTNIALLSSSCCFIGGCKKNCTDTPAPHIGADRGLCRC